MYSSTLVSLLTVASLSTATICATPTASYPTASSTPSSPCNIPADFPFDISLALNVKIEVGKPLNATQISGPGVLINEPITGGTVEGPSIKAKVQGGFAHPSMFANNTLSVPAVDLYGTTDDGQAYYLHASGVGTPQKQVVRLEFTIGGAEYEPFANGFVIASLNPTEDRKTVYIKGYFVKNIATAPQT